jgi:putative transposase
VIWGVDGGKLVTGRKRHLGTDPLGLVHGLVVTEANLNDREGAKLLVEQLRGRAPRLVKLLVDQGYTGVDLAAWVLAMRGGEVEVVSTRPGQVGFAVQSKRWIAARTLGWLNYSRRLSKDYEELPATSATMIRIAMIHVMLNRLNYWFLDRL